jgi:hypothetical protein
LSFNRIGKNQQVGELVLKTISTTAIMSTLLVTSASLSYAADTIVVAEPEPMEYVRVCDAYGVGFFYIPGTEHCLRISGFVQYDVAAGELLGRTSLDKKTGLEKNETYYSRARFALQADARTETDLGTLRGYTEIWFDHRSTNVPPYSGKEHYYEMKQAFMDLGGWRAGYTHSLYKTMTLHAGRVIQEELVPFGPRSTNLISYTYEAGNGFTAAVSLEHGDGLVHTIDSYVPHMVAGAAFQQKWGSIRGVVGYDSNYEEWAGKIRVDLQPTDSIALWAMVGYGTDDHIANSVYKPWGGNWAAWGGGSARLSSKLGANIALGYDENENFALVANVLYNVTPGFYIQPEISYKDNFKTSNSDSMGGWLRFRRSF